MVGLAAVLLGVVAVEVVVVGCPAGLTGVVSAAGFVGVVEAGVGLAGVVVGDGLGGVGAGLLVIGDVCGFGGADPPW